MNNILIACLVVILATGIILVGSFIHRKRLEKKAKKANELRTLNDLRTMVRLLDSDLRLHKINEYEYTKGLAEVSELLDKFEKDLA